MGLRWMTSGHHDGSGEAPGGHPDASPPPVAAAAPPAVDADGAFLQRHMGRALEKGRLTNESANYFQRSFGAFDDVRPAVSMARKHIGDSDPERWTSFQQQQFSNMMAAKCGEIAALRLQKAYKEQQDMKQLGEDGRATGENYWMEAGESLLSADVPAHVKEDIIADMQSDRQKDSPAFAVDVDTIPPHMRDLLHAAAPSSGANDSIPFGGALPQRPAVPAAGRPVPAF